MAPRLRTTGLGVILLKKGELNSKPATRVNGELSTYLASCCILYLVPVQLTHNRLLLALCEHIIFTHFLFSEIAFSSLSIMSANSGDITYMFILAIYRYCKFCFCANIMAFPRSEIPGMSGRRFEKIHRLLSTSHPTCCFAMARQVSVWQLATSTLYGMTPMVEL